MLLEKEAEGPLKADDKGESSNEENLQRQKKKSGNILEKGSKLQAHAIKYPVLSSASYKYHPNRLKESNYLH